MNDLNKSSSSSDSSCNSSLNEPTVAEFVGTDIKSPVSYKSTQVTLVEELINSSEDEKVYEKQLDSVSDSYFGEDNTSSELKLTHSCSYFEHGNSNECDHALSMHQNICLKCDHSSELKDSLDFMAFTSPVANEISNKNWHQILTVDNSPSLNGQEVVPEEDMTFNKVDHSLNNSAEMNTIIDDTLDQTSNLILFIY